MNPFRSARLSARDVWQRSVTRPLLSPEELRDLEMALNDLEHALKAHQDALTEQRTRMVG